MKPIVTSLLTGSLLLLISAAMAGETNPSTGAVAKDVPYGHKDFHPSPQRPIGYRGDGSNVFPDAKPPTTANETTKENILWKVPLPNWGYSQPLVVGRKVFVTCEAGWPEEQDFPLLVCCDAETGKELWRRSLAETCYYGAPIYHNRALFVPTAAGALWKLDAENGRVLWRAATTGPVYATPRIADGRVFLGDNSGVMQVFSADSGELLARFQAEREIQGRALLWQGQLLFGSRDHKVHALKVLDQPVP